MTGDYRLQQLANNVATYFKGSQDGRNVFVDGRSGPDRVPGNLFRGN